MSAVGLAAFAFAARAASVMEKARAILMFIAVSFSGFVGVDSQTSCDAITPISRSIPDSVSGAPGRFDAAFSAFTVERSVGPGRRARS
jgi:hypothetical protein